MAGLFPPALLDQIRAASDIVEIIGAALPLKRAGANFVALCPFHKEKTPSFNVNPHRQIFHCFGCHKGGDVFTFVKEYENLSFPEAVRRLAERARIPLPEKTETGSSAAQTRYLKETLLQIHEQIARRWHAALTHEAAGQLARDYLARRQVSDEAVQRFRLGYAPDAWDDTVNWATAKGYDLALMEQAGLVIRKEGEARAYDRFRGRLMFPIADEQGRIIAFSGRILTADAKVAKYVNSPETPIFSKGRVCFGLDKAKRPILDAGYAVVCEGQLDLITCHMAGIQNVVAPQGTALTADHARILKRYTDEVVLCFDSDRAGQAAAIRAWDDLLAAGLAIRVACVPPPHDPDSFIKAQGADAFLTLLTQAEGFFDYYLSRLCAENDPASDKGRLRIVRGMGEALAKTGSPVLADTYAQKIAQRLAVTSDAIRAEFKRTRAPAGPAASAAPEPTGPPRPPPLELWLLKLLLASDDLVAWTGGHLDPAWLHHPGVREIVARRLQADAERRWKGVASLMGELAADSLQALVSEAVSDPRPIPNPGQQLQDVLLRLRNRFLDQELAGVRHRLATPGLEPSELARLAHLQQQLMLAKRRPLASRDAGAA
jgi:DNA primase